MADGPPQSDGHQDQAVDIKEWFAEGPLKTLNREQRRAIAQHLERLEVVQVSASHSQSYSGPLPPPELLTKFNEVIPNGAERIMVMAEKQNNHRIAIETTVVNNQQRQSTVGQYFALLITITALALAGWLIYLGHDGAGGTIGVAAVTSVAVAFITGRNKQTADLKAKR